MYMHVYVQTMFNNGLVDLEEFNDVHVIAGESLSISCTVSGHVC